MEFYYEIDSWKEIPLNKTFALTEATSFTAAIDRFDKKEKLLPSFVINEAGSSRYWMPADLLEWSPEEVKDFTSRMRSVER